MPIHSGATAEERRRLVQGAPREDRPDRPLPRQLRPKDLNPPLRTNSGGRLFTLPTHRASSLFYSYALTNRDKSDARGTAT